MAHGFLSYQDPRGEVDYLDKIYKAIKKYLDGREKREKKEEDKGGALVKGPDPDPFDDGGPITESDISVENPRSAPPLRKALAGSALQRTLPSAMATAAEVRGGALAKTMGFSGKALKPEGFVSDAIVNVDYQNLGVERDLPGDEMFVKSLNVIHDEISDGSADVVEAIVALNATTFDPTSDITFSGNNTFTGSNTFAGLTFSSSGITFADGTTQTTAATTTGFSIAMAVALG